MAPRQQRLFGPKDKAPSLTPEKVNEIRHITSGTMKEAAAKYGVSEGTISNIWHNRSPYDKIPVTPPPTAAPPEKAAKPHK